MKVLNATTTLQGGAGIASTRLHNALLEIGVDSWLVALDHHYPRELVSVANLILVSPPRRASISSSISTVTNRIITREPSVHFTPLSIDTFDIQLLKDLSPDVMHIHNSYNFINRSTFSQEIFSRLKVICTLHDQRFLTGGCHNSLQCTNYLRSCSKCPQAHSPAKFMAKRNLSSAKNFRPNEPPSLISPSRWLFDMAKKSPIGKNCKVFEIPNCLPTDIFAPELNSSLGSSDDNFVISWFSGKDSQTIIDAITILNLEVSFSERRKIRLRHTGKCNQQFFACEHFNLIAGEIQSANFYRGSSCFIISTIGDNFPNVCIEALSCGVPVISTLIGGSFEAAGNADAGLSFPVGNSEVLAERILTLLRNPAMKNQMSVLGRKAAITKYSPTIVANQHKEVYEDVLGN